MINGFSWQVTSLSCCFIHFFPSILSSFLPSFIPSFCPSLPSPTKSHNLFPLTVGLETDSTRWQIYLHQHEVKHLKHLVTVAGPLPERWEVSFISAGVPVKGSSHISPQQGTLSACLRKLLSHPTSSWKARIFSFLKTCSFLKFLHFLNKRVYEPYVWDFPSSLRGGEAGSHLHPGQHMYLPKSGNWLEVCNDRARRCNKPKPTPSPTNLPQNHLVGGTIIHRGPSLTQMLEAYGWSITQRTQMHTYADSTYTLRRIYIKRTPCFRSFCLSETQHY